MFIAALKRNHFSKDFILVKSKLSTHIKKMTESVIVNQQCDDPTNLWNKLEITQNQKGLDIKKYTTEVSMKKEGYTRFVLISDTHNKTDNLTLPDGDILLHAGDFTKLGKPDEVEHFNEYLKSVKEKYKHVIVICGNHELTFDPVDTHAKRFLELKYKHLDHREMKSMLTDCRYIEDESVEVMGFKIYGSPWQPYYNGWAYNLTRGEKCLEKWNLIPDDTDILITHGPPLGYGDLCITDLRAGCSELLSTVQQRVKPKLHVFGHIHEGYGIWSDGVTTYVNASTCMKRNHSINLPIVVDLKSPTC